MYCPSIQFELPTSWFPYLFLSPRSALASVGSILRSFSRPPSSPSLVPMVHTRSSIPPSSSASIASNPFEDKAAADRAPSPSRTTNSALGPASSTASTASVNPFDASSAPPPPDPLVLELRKLNVSMTRALEALSFLTAQALSSHPPVFPPQVVAHPEADPQPVRHAPKPSPPSPSPCQDDDSITSGISISSVRTARTLREAVHDLVQDSKSKTIKIPSFDEAKLQEPAYVRDWCERAIALISAHSYYASLVNRTVFLCRKYSTSCPIPLST